MSTTKQQRAQKKLWIALLTDFLPDFMHCLCLSGQSVHLLSRVLASSLTATNESRIAATDKVAPSAKACNSFLCFDRQTPTSFKAWLDCSQDSAWSRRCRAQTAIPSVHIHKLIAYRAVTGTCASTQARETSHSADLATSVSGGQNLARCSFSCWDSLPTSELGNLCAGQSPGAWQADGHASGLAVGNWP